MYTHAFWFPGSDSDTPSKPSVRFEMELSDAMQNQYGKQFKDTAAPGKSKKSFFMNFIIVVSSSETNNFSFKYSQC